MNQYIEYPRSGWHWFLLRSASFLRRCCGMTFHPGSVEGVIKGTHNKYPGELLDMHCMGFDFAESGHFALENQIRLNKDGKVFITLRDATCTLPSYFHFATTFPTYANMQLFGPEATLRGFLAGDYSIPRICRFLNGVAELKKHLPVQIFYYEDRFNPESVVEIPKILGIDYQLSEEEKIQIFEETQINTLEENQDVAETDIGSMYRIGSPNSSLSNTNQRKVNRYLRKYCQLEEYRERYL